VSCNWLCIQCCFGILGGGCQAQEQWLPISIVLTAARTVQDNLLSPTTSTCCIFPYLKCNHTQAAAPRNKQQPGEAKAKQAAPSRPAAAKTAKPAAGQGQQQQPPVARRP
jgi:hypothetical protein